MSRDKAKTEGLFHREASVALIPREEGSDAAPQLKLSFSSDVPYRRQTWGGYKFDEVLSHKPGDIDLSKMDGAPFLDSHWMERESVLGVIKAGSAKTDGHRATAVVNLDTKAPGYDAFNRHLEMGMDKVSVGYRVNKWKTTLAAERTDGVTDADLKVATSWTPHEASSVLVPADDSVGIGRSGDPVVVDKAVPPVNNAGEDSINDQQPESAMPPEDRTETETRSDTQPTVAAPAPALSVVDNSGSGASEMVKLGREYPSVGGVELAAEFIEKGGSIEALSQAIMQKMHEKLEKDATPEAEAKRAEAAKIGMSRKEMCDFSLRKLFLASAFPNNAKYRKEAGLEFEASQAAAEANGRTDGVTSISNMAIPYDVLAAPLASNRNEAQAMARFLVESGVGSKIPTFQRAISTGGATEGANLIETQLLAASFIDLLRANSAFLPLATRLPNMVGNVDIPRQLTGPTISWVAESDANDRAAPTDPTLDQVQLRAKHLYGETDFTQSMLVQSSIAIEAFIRMNLIIELALKIDMGVMVGSGVNEPKGMLHADNLGVVNVGNPPANKIQVYAGTFPNVNTGQPLNRGALIGMRTAVARANAPMGGLRFMVNPDTVGKLMVEAIDAGSGVFLYDTRTPERPLIGYPVSESTQVPNNRVRGTSTNLSAVAFGDMNQIIYASWGSGFDVQVDPYSDRRKGFIRVSVIDHADIGFRQASSLVVMDQVVHA